MNNMNKFEFISIKEFPEGQYPTAIATVRVNLKDEKGFPVREVIRYARKTAKDGGVFWAMATHTVTVNGEKKYLPGFKLDSELDEELLIDFIKQSVKNLQAGNVQMSGQVHYPHGLVQPAPSMPIPPEFPQSMSDMVQEQIPF
jgi:hypothetical protein